MKKQTDKKIFNKFIKDIIESVDGCYCEEHRNCLKEVIKGMIKIEDVNKIIKLLKTKHIDIYGEWINIKELKQSLKELGEK